MVLDKRPAAQKVRLTALLLGILTLIVVGTAVALLYPSANDKKSNTTPTAVAAAKAVPLGAKPLWVDLSSQQKIALAPLYPEWDTLDDTRKKKWLGIVDKYSAKKPDEQARIHDRMRDWVKLTPEQRMDARENFARTKQISPEQKNAHWQQYQQLSDEQKKQLVLEANQKKSITNLPSEAQRSVKPLAPIKTGPAPAPKLPLPVPEAKLFSTASSNPASPTSSDSSISGAIEK